MPTFQFAPDHILSCPSLPLPITTSTAERLELNTNDAIIIIKKTAERRQAYVALLGAPCH
jgi:hypothetical protein